jgi:hypothetical protein
MGMTASISTHRGAHRLPIGGWWTTSFTRVKTEEDVQQRWVDARLTLACREGFTLIYDEFNRSRPEANNAL